MHNKFNVLFVCTGNVFRSAFAHHLFQALTDRKYQNSGLPNPFCFRSAGTRGGIRSDGKRKEMPQTIVKPAWHKLEMARELGLDPDKHQSEKLTFDIAEEADIIIVMDETHLSWIKDSLGTQFLRKTVFYEALASRKIIDIADLPYIMPDLSKLIDNIEKGIKKGAIHLKFDSEIVNTGLDFVLDVLGQMEASSHVFIDELGSGLIKSTI